MYIVYSNKITHTCKSYSMMYYKIYIIKYILINHKISIKKFNTYFIFFYHTRLQVYFIIFIIVKYQPGWNIGILVKIPGGLSKNEAVS